MQRSLLERVRDLRREQTDAERKLWLILRGRRFSDVKFRRQYLIGSFIVDFCCFDQRLIVELDGGQHAKRQETDAKRTRFLESQGFRVLRFWNEEVLTEPESVLERIFEVLR